MPSWLYQLLQNPPTQSIITISKDGQLSKRTRIINETPYLLPALAQLLECDQTVDKVYLCHPAIVHIAKLPREGGFCGYRNLQMLLSYIRGAMAQGHEHFPQQTPGILQLQDLIESAWDAGINPEGRIETGGVKDTRKYIGTPEVQAVCLLLGIDCRADVCLTQEAKAVKPAHEQLLDLVEACFEKAGTESGKVRKTVLPPMYFQQRGHSLTVVGLEKSKDGHRILLVFDPAYRPSPAIQKLLGHSSSRPTSKRQVEDLLEPYRRCTARLKKHRNFELLT